MPCPPCIFCMCRVHSNPRAVTCDCCHRWHNIKCWDTAISVEEYNAVVRDGTDIVFLCQRCLYEEVDEDVDQLTDDEE